MDLKKIAEDVFKRYPKTDKIFITSDGQAFFDQAHAQNHALKNRTGKELTVESFLREGTTEAKQTEKTLNVKKMIDYINLVDSIEELQGIIDAETNGQGRITVVNYANKRIEQLKPVE